MYNVSRSIKLDSIEKQLYYKRQSNHLARGIQFLLNGDFEKPRIIFNKCLDSDVDRAFLNGLHKGMCLNSGNEDMKNVAINYLSGYKVE